MKQTIGRSPIGKGGLIGELVKNGRLVFRLLKDNRVSTGVKLLIPGLTIGYLLFPVDVLPDLVPVLGQLDDLAVLALGMKFFIEMCPPGIVKQHLDEIAGRVGGGIPGSDRGSVVEGEYRVID